LQTGILPLRDIKHDTQRAAPRCAAPAESSRNQTLANISARPPWYHFAMGAGSGSQGSWVFLTLRHFWFFPAQHRPFKNVVWQGRDRLCSNRVRSLLALPRRFSVRFRNRATRSCGYGGAGSIVAPDRPRCQSSPARIKGTHQSARARMPSRTWPCLKS